MADQVVCEKTVVHGQPFMVACPCTIMARHLPINKASPPRTIIPDKQISFSLNVIMYQGSHGNEIKDIFGH